MDYFDPKFDCICILYGGLDAWPINTEIPGMTLLFVEKGMSNSMVFHCISKLIFDNLLWAWGAQTHPGTAGCQISDIWNLFCRGGRVSINIPWKLYSERQSSCPLGD